jgi:thiaminase (transcriptional activator TenA)
VTFSDDLRTATTKTWDAAVSHRFVDELWAGRLAPAVLGGHLVQRRQVLIAFLELVGAAVARADQNTDQPALASRLGPLAAQEADYLDRAMDAFDVPLGHRTEPVLVEAARELSGLMDDVRAGGDYPSCVTVLLVADWLSMDWAGRTDADLPTDVLQREWIAIHQGTPLENWVAFLRSEFDRVTAALDDDGRDRIGALFTRTAELELAFFDSAYT